MLSPLHYLISPKYPRVQKRSAVITSYATVDRKSTKYIVRDVGGAEGPGKNALKFGRDDMIEEAGKHIPNATSFGYS